MNNNKIDRINRSTMRSVAREYAGIHELTAAEIAALEKVECPNDGPILDLGVGGGRTVAPLRSISSNYIGVDYVAEMVEACREKHPDCRFEQGDARKLDGFGDSSFHMVFFSMNGISMVDHAGRMEILREVYRLLKPGGYFLFSTYNLESPGHRRLLRLPPISLSANPFRTLVRCARFTRNLSLSLANRIRLKRHETHGDGYAIINDRCHNYSTLLYYIRMDKQLEQLEETGFPRQLVQTFDLQGRQVEDSTHHDSIFYLAIKPSATSAPSS